MQESECKTRVNDLLKRICANGIGGKQPVLDGRVFLEVIYPNYLNTSPRHRPEPRKRGYDPNRFQHAIAGPLATENHLCFNASQKPSRPVRQPSAHISLIPLAHDNKYIFYIFNKIYNIIIIC